MAKIAFVFSGQGSQYSGMGKELAESSNSASQIFKLADSIRAGTSDQCFNGSAEELKMTRNTQPCIFCVGFAAASALRENGIKPDCLAGFSLGEIPALAFGGYLSTEDAFRFVVKRAEYMDDCGKKNPGTMYAVLGLNEETVTEICHGNAEWYPVNFNEEKQTVIACSIKEADGLPQAVKDKGGKAIKLPVSGSFHSPLMDEARTRLEKEFQMIPYKNGEITVYSNVTAQPYDGVDLMFRQINSPVRWHKLIRNIYDQGIDIFIEVGPGKTLTNLISKILPSVTALNVEDAGSLNHALEVITC